MDKNIGKRDCKKNHKPFSWKVSEISAQGGVKLSGYLQAEGKKSDLTSDRRTTHLDALPFLSKP